MLIYLATPYSDPDPKVRELRYLDAMQACEPFARYKVAVYAPIVHWHPFAVRFNFAGDHATWWAQDKAFLDVSREAWFLQQEGSAMSRGMQNEYNYARAHRITTRNVFFSELEENLCLLVQKRNHYSSVA